MTNASWSLDSLRLNLIYMFKRSTKTATKIEVLLAEPTTIRGLPHSISHTAFPFSETLRYRIDLEHGVDRFLLHKLLAFAQYNQSHAMTCLWKISALRFDGRNVPARTLMAWASRAITYEEIERDFDAEAAEKAKVASKTEPKWS